MVQHSCQLSLTDKAGNHREAHHTQNRALEVCLSDCFCCCWIGCAKGPLVALCLNGAFSNEDAVATGYTLSAFAVGLPAYVLVKIFSTQFFARQDTKTPMKVAIAAVSLNFVLNCLFIGTFGYVGLALSTARSAWVNAIVLGYLLFMKQWIVMDPRIKAIMPRLVFSSLMMGGLCYGFQVLTPFPKESLMRMLVVALWIGGDCWHT